MKKNLLMTVIAAICLTQVFSQTKGASFGIQIGGNLASSNIKFRNSTNNDDKVNTDSRIGYIGGLVSEFQLGPISLRPELNFIQKGFKYNNSASFFGSTVATTDNKLVLNYIELPLNVTFNVPSGSSHLFVGLGPVFSLGLSGKYKSQTSVIGINDDSEVDVNFDGDENATDDDIHLKRFDLGADVIAGYKLAAGFTVSVGYTFGISNILPRSDSDNDDNDNSWRNNGLALKVGYMFGGGSNKSSTTTSSSSSSSNF